MSSDTIEVRPDEQLNIPSLLAYLQPHYAELGLPPQAPLTVRQFGGGMANLTYLLDFGSAQFVLRRPPLGPIAKSAHDMGREFLVLSKLWQAFPLAPRAYLYTEDPQIIGAPFFVMERREGVVVRTHLPPQFETPAAPRLMSEALVDALAAFHAVDYSAIGLAQLGQAEGFIGRQIEGWYQRWCKAKHTEVPEIEAVYQWLSHNQPPHRYSTLVHNDYKLDNVLFDPADPGRLRAIFDWDMCTIGDPLSDLGALLTYWTDPSDPPYLQMLAATFMPTGKSFLTRPELVARYASQTGFDVSHSHFYHTLGLFRLTVIIAQIYIRYVRGQTQDKRFAMLGEMIPLLGRAAQNIMNGKN